MPRAWRLYIDESGKFDDDEDEVAVAGMLVDSAVSATTWPALRRSLEAAWPGFTWPLHAWLTNRWCTTVLCAARTKPGALDVQESHDALDALQVLEQHAAQALAVALRALDEGREPGSRVLDALELCLEVHAGDLAVSLQSTAQQRRERIMALAAWIAAQAGAASGSPATLLVASSEERTGACLGAPDRYLELLAALLDRAATVLARFDGSHEVTLHVCTRDVYDTTIARQRPLHSTHIGACARRARRTDTVRFIVGSIHEWTSHAHPGLVLADLAANRARHALGPSGLAAAERALSPLGWALRSGAPPRTHLAAWGQDGPTTPTKHPRGVSPWAIEQAREWTEAAP